jgi:ABC-type branched-subunit amino acid transport system substrate-binding protein
MIGRRGLMIGATMSSAIPALTYPDPAQAAASPYMLGTLFPMSGPNAEYGEIFTAGADMALAHVGADKMLRRPIVMKAVDSLATPQGGAIGMSRLVNVDRAIYVLVGFTGVSKAAAPIGMRAKSILVNGGGIGPDLAGLTPYFWNVIPLANKEVERLAPWAVAKGLKRIAAVYVDDPYGIGVVTSLKSSFSKAGGKVVAAYPISPTDQEFAAIAAKLRAVKPDAVYFASYGAQQSEIIKQLRNNGVTQQLLSPSSVDIPSVHALPQSKGLIYTAQPADWNSPDPVTRRFVQDWKAKYHKDPVPYNQNYYNAVLLFALLASALEKQGKPVNGENLRNQLLAQRSFPLVGGTGVFDDNGDISLPIVIKQFQAGGKVVKIA